MNNFLTAIGIYILCSFVNGNWKPFMEIMVVEFRSSIPGVSYIPSSTGYYVQKEVRPSAGDSTIRAALGIKHPLPTMTTANVCGAANMWMVYILPYFFANQSNTVITANPFQTMACKLDDQVPSKGVPYDKTVFLIGFAQFQVLRVPGDPRTIKMKPGGIYSGLREDAVKSELLDMLDASFGSISNGIAPSVLQKDNAGEQQDEEEELHPIQPDVGYKARALLKETWSDSLDNLSDPRAQNLSQTFCKDIQAAYASAFYKKDFTMNCSNYKFFLNTYTDPITKMTSQYTTISVDFSFQDADFIHFSSAEMTASVNQGLMKINREYQSKTIGSIQIMRLSEFFTCAKDGDRCSKWATCVQLSSGIACVCSFLHNDVDKSMPGTVCHYNMSVVILYAVLGSGSFCALLMAILFVSRGPRVHHMTG